MLPKYKRLNLSNDFKWVSLGKSITSHHFRFFGRSGENTNARVGIAITSKIFPKATLRSKAKRIISSAFEQIYDTLPEHLNIIALPKQGIDKVKSEDLILELKEAIEKIK